MTKDRRIVYIRSADRRPLYFRFIGGTFHLVLRVLYPDEQEHCGHGIAIGDFVEIETTKRVIRLEVGEDSDFTEELKFIALQGNSA